MEKHYKPPKKRRYGSVKCPHVDATYLNQERKGTIHPEMVGDNSDFTFIMLKGQDEFLPEKENHAENLKIWEGGNMEIKSPAFEEGAFIPRKYTCDGMNVSPPLEWSLVPEVTKAFALICDDPDASMRTWVHWVLYNIPGDQNRISEDIPPMEVLENGAMHGKNDFRRTGYGGPCPPRGTHRYFYKIYALDEVLDLDPGISKKALLKAMEGHVLAEGQLVGRYKR
jgi:Raf kinase inhibitor-like YbhB/YbcL family protein